MPRAQVYPGLKQVRHRRRPGAGVAVGPGAEHQPGLGPGQEVAIRRAQLSPVDREGPGPQESQAFEVSGGARPRRLKFRNPAAPAFQQALKEAVASRQKVNFRLGFAQVHHLQPRPGDVPRVLTARNKAADTE